MCCVLTSFLFSIKIRELLLHVYENMENYNVIFRLWQCSFMEECTYHTKVYIKFKTYLYHLLLNKEHGTVLNICLLASQGLYDLFLVTTD